MRRLARAAAALALVAAAAPEASALRRRPPAPGHAWLTARSGLVFADTVTLADTLLDPADTLAPAFTLGALWRTPRFDVGLLLEHLAGGRFLRLETDARLGGEVRGAALLRWRYVEEPWGGLFLGFSPGLAVTSVSDAVRFEASRLAGGALEDVASTDAGFSFGLDTGLVVYLRDRLALQAGVGVVSSLGRLGHRAASDLAFARTRGLFSVGLEWRP